MDAAERNRLMAVLRNNTKPMKITPRDDRTASEKLEAAGQLRLSFEENAIKRS